MNMTIIFKSLDNKNIVKIDRNLTLKKENDTIKLLYKRKTILNFLEKVDKKSHTIEIIEHNKKSKFQKLTNQITSYMLETSQEYQQKYI